MAARQIPRRRRRRILPHRNLKQHRRTTLCNSFTNNCLTSCSHEHPYATRSKSLLDVGSVKFENLSRQSSDSSIICLGSFHKTPQLITLDDGSDEQSETAVKHLEMEKASESEEVNDSEKSVDSLMNKYYFLPD